MAGYTVRVYSCGGLHCEGVFLRRVTLWGCIPVAGYTVRVYSCGGLRCEVYSCGG